MITFEKKSMTSQRKNNLCPGICHSYPTLLSQRITIYRMDAAAAAKSFQSCPTLCDPIDGSPPGPSISGILQAWVPEWVVISFSNACMHAKLLQSCPTPCDPMDSSPPGSSVHRTLQARILEWVAISFSKNHFIIYVNQIVMLYILNLYSDICQLFLNKIGKNFCMEI